MAEAELESSGLGAPPNEGSDDMRMVCGSLGSSNEILGLQKQYNQVNKSSDDLTMDMLGDHTTTNSRPQPNYYGNQYYDQNNNHLQITSKNPPTSALNLHQNLNQRVHENNYNAVDPSIMSLEQYRQNNAKLQVLMQYDSTPQFNYMPQSNYKIPDSAPINKTLLDGSNQQSKSAIGSATQNSNDTLNEVSQFNYNQQYTQYQYRQNSIPTLKPEALDQIDKIRENISKIEVLNQAIQLQPSNQNANRRNTGALGLQAAGKQILYNENKNQQNNLQPQAPIQQQLKIDKAKSMQTPDQVLLQNQHKEIMKDFDDIPINKIKTMVGYQTNIDMYSTEAKLPQSEEDQQVSSQPVLHTVREIQKNDNSDDSEGEEGLTLLERLYARQWKIRMRACKEINQMFYNDYAKSQSDPSHPLQSFDEFGPQLQEMIKDTNLTNAYEALQCLHSYVKFANDIRQVTFACSVYLLEKVQTNKANFREITLKIILCMLRRLQGPSNTILPELMKRLNSKNSKCASFCIQIIVEAFKSKEQVIIQEINLKQLFKAIQGGLVHQNKEIRDSAYSILKFICERCKDDANIIVQNCQNLRPVQIKEITEELAKVQKLQNNLSLFDDHQEEQIVESKFQKQKTVVEPKVEEKTQVNSEQEAFDLCTIVPDDFQEIPYAQAINIKKKSMETFNSELQKIVDKGPNASVKAKDYSTIINVVFHMLEDKNMLVFMEAIKSVELLIILQQLKKEKIRPFVTLLAGKYGETKTAVIAATDRTMLAITKHSMSTVQFSDLVINQICISHKNPRVKQFLLTNTLTQMLAHCEQPATVFKTISKNLVQLVLKDNNDAVRNAAVQLVIEFGLLKLNDMNFQAQVQAVVQQLPKTRIQEINKKLSPAPVTALENEQQFAKTQAPPKKAAQIDQTEDEFSKTLTPAVQLNPAQQFNNFIRCLKLLANSQVSPLQLKKDCNELLQNKETLNYFIQNRALLIKITSDVLTSNSKALQNQKEIVKVIVVFVKDLFINSTSSSQSEIQDFIQIGLILAEIGLDNDVGMTSQILVLAMESASDIFAFVEMLRNVVELSSIINTSQAIKIISNVYTWLGLQLSTFQDLGMSFSEIEELRGIGIKYLESTHIFNEKQRQQLISVMIRFKDQITEVRNQALHTLGQQSIQDPQTSRSQQSSILDTKQQTAQFNDSSMTQSKQKPQITGQLICQTIDSEFEQGLLMFKELAQSNEGLDFQTKEMIFQKLLSIVSEGLTQSQAHNPQQQQYKQAYALKALMWMKEETMGLEDTFKLTTPILQVYVMQINKQIDASVELYLLNFWVRELSVRDLADRIQMAVSQLRQSRNSNRSHHNSKMSSDEQLEGFSILFQWFIENKLEQQDWKLSDLRKIALLVCESVLSPQGHCKQICNGFLQKCVARDGSEKVLEFMEIQLMHSNEVFIQFLDWFQVQFPKKQQIAQKQQVVPKVDVQLTQNLNVTSADDLVTDRSDSNSVSYNHLSYMERRKQMKSLNQKQAKEQIEQSENHVQQIIHKIEAEESYQSYHQSQIQSQQQNTKNVEQRRSRYDEQMHKDNSQESLHKEDAQQEVLPIEEIKEASTRILSAQSKINYSKSLEEKVQQSEAKQRDWVQKIIQLEAEKRRIEEETSLLKQQTNQQSQMWQQKLNQMQIEHQTVIQNLSEVNQCYLQQVDENEHLKEQLLMMQKQHQDMLTRFEQIERKVNSKEVAQRKSPVKEQEQPKTPPRTERIPRDHIMNSVAKLKRISDTFQVTDQQIGIHKICELLLSVERNVDGELAKPLISHYCKMRTMEERLSMINAIGEALSVNEDILLALSIDVYKALLNFLLRAFAHEKERLDTQSLGRQDQRLEQNQVTLESQKIVSRLLNSKDFTSSLVCLFQLLREAMPADLRPELPIEEGQYLRVLMRCISRITKALHSESSDLIRGFDVLLEMQKIFIICPPENLKEDLPSLADFDFVFRGMKDVSDKFIDLQPEKVASFLGYSVVREQPDNAFIKYLRMKTLQR